MTLTTFSSAEAFLAAVRPVLGQHEAEHHLVLGVAEAYARVASRVVSPNGDLFVAVAEDDDGFAMAALMTGHHPLLVASDRASVSAATAPLCDALAAAGRVPRHVIGAGAHAESVAAEMARRSGRFARVAMRQRVYKLTELAPLPLASGSLRVATIADLDLVTAWVEEFEREALASVLPLSSARAVAERKVAAGELYLWCDPEPRTMAGSARPTKRAIAVNAVYTPPEWRRRGYATACVAELSALLLRRGFEFCVLYTDLANPTSNAIYARIGYRPVRDFLMYELPLA